MLARLNCQSTLQQSLVDRRQPSVRKLLNGAGKKSYVPAYGKSAVLTHGAAKRASKPRAACALTRRRPRESEVRPCAMQNLSEEQDMTAVIVVDHGSRREASNKMLFDFVDMYRHSSGRLLVEGAHMEIAKPSISDAMRKCVQAGAKQIIVAPYFLSRGRHIQQDIPALVREAQQEHSAPECIIAEPIGLDPLMAQLIEARVRNAASGVLL